MYNVWGDCNHNGLRGICKLYWLNNFDSSLQRQVEELV